LDIFTSLKNLDSEEIILDILNRSPKFVLPEERVLSHLLLTRGGDMNRFWQSPIFKYTPYIFNRDQVKNPTFVDSHLLAGERGGGNLRRRAAPYIGENEDDNDLLENENIPNNILTTEISLDDIENIGMFTNSSTTPAELNTFDVRASAEQENLRRRREEIREDLRRRVSNSGGIT
jgi:hypothetical protein